MWWNMSSRDVVDIFSLMAFRIGHLGLVLVLTNYAGLFDQIFSRFTHNYLARWGHEHSS
jgi:hypothetical protein